MPSTKHRQAVEKVEEILKDVPSGQLMPALARPKFQVGEFRRHKDGANEGHVDIDVAFSSVNCTDNKINPTYLASSALSGIVKDKVTEKYGLYAASFGHQGYYSITPSFNLTLVTGKKEQAVEVLEYALEIIRDPETLSSIAERHEEWVEKSVSGMEVSQPKIEGLASVMNDRHAIGASLYSYDKIIDDFRKTTADQVADVIKELNECPIFLDLRGHSEALDALPPIEIVDAWRSSPNRGKNPAAIEKNKVNAIPEP